MKLKANSILNIYESLCKIADKETDFHTACMIATNIKNLTIAKEILDKRRNEIVTKYAAKNDDGSIQQEETGNIKITNMNDFLTEMNTLLASETEVELTKISKESISELKVSAKDVLGLIDILSEV